MLIMNTVSGAYAVVCPMLVIVTVNAKRWNRYSSY